jgi:putative ABC transport system permease protein
MDVDAALRAGARAAVPGGSRSRTGHALIGFEVVLAFVLLVAVGVLLQSLVRLGRVQPGFRTDHLLTAKIALPDRAYPSPIAIATFQEKLAAGLSSIPGVRAASAVFPLPMSGALTTTSFNLADRPLPPGRQPTAVTRLVGADYFQTMGIPLARGRFFADTDRLQSPPVVIVNERFVQEYFPDQNPIGRQMTTGWTVGTQAPQVREVVGIVGNAKRLSLRDEFVPEMYVPLSQVPYPAVAILVRTETLAPTAVADAVRREVSRLDPEIPLTAVRPFEEYRVGSLAGARFNVLLLSTFAAVALALTAVGIYGVIAHTVAARTRELGVRLALGAHPPTLVREIVWNTMTVVGVSIAVGVAAALACVRLMRGLLFGTGPSDPATFALTILLIVGVALLASGIPARRVSAVDPMVALRVD